MVYIFLRLSCSKNFNKWKVIPQWSLLFVNNISGIVLYVFIKLMIFYYDLRGLTKQGTSRKAQVSDFACTVAGIKYVVIKQI